MRWGGIVRELRSYGLDVRTVKGWRHRSAGTPFDPQGVLEHHTASSRHGGNTPALGICVHGRDGIPGPLANALIARDATIILIGRGKANHAGLGGPWRWIPTNAGNTFAFGIEIENDGVGEPYPAEQKRAAAILTAVLLRRMNRGMRRVGAHKEYTSRKIDPSFSMGAFRRKVRRALRRRRQRRRPILGKGDRGRWVRRLQRRLRRGGYGPGPIDGIFGPKTERAVRRLQRAEALEVDGIAGRDEWRALRRR